MKISVKGRYGLASALYLARCYGKGELVTASVIAQQLGISKIYLEQVFSLLKKSGVLASTKGAQGGYQLARQPEDISAYDILSAIELSMMEKTEDTVREQAPDVEHAMRYCVFEPLDGIVEQTLRGIPLSRLVREADQNGMQDYMFFI